MPSIRTESSDPCLCGDPECTLCFPVGYDETQEEEYNPYEDPNWGRRDYQYE